MFAAALLSAVILRAFSFPFAACKLLLVAVMRLTRMYKPCSVARLCLAVKYA